jgi:hypothetical protein
MESCVRLVKGVGSEGKHRGCTSASEFDRNDARAQITHPFALIPAEHGIETASPRRRSIRCDEPRFGAD